VIRNTLKDKAKEMEENGHHHLKEPVKTQIKLPHSEDQSNNNFDQ
jgi:hypothetical protein